MGLIVGIFPRFVVADVGALHRNIRVSQSWAGCRRALQAPISIYRFTQMVLVPCLHLLGISRSVKITTANLMHRRRAFTISHPDAHLNDQSYSRPYKEH